MLVHEHNTPHILLLQLGYFFKLYVVLKIVEESQRVHAGGKFWGFCWSVCVLRVSAISWVPMSPHAIALVQVVHLERRARSSSHLPILPLLSPLSPPPPPLAPPPAPKHSPTHLPAYTLTHSRIGSFCPSFAVREESCTPARTRWTASREY